MPCAKYVACRLDFVLTSEQAISAIRRADRYSIDRSPHKFGPHEESPIYPFVWRVVGANTDVLTEVNLIMDEGRVARFTFDPPSRSSNSRVVTTCHISVWELNNTMNPKFCVDTRLHQEAFAIFRIQLLGIFPQVPIQINVEGLANPPEPEDPPEPPHTA